MRDILKLHSGTPSGTGVSLSKKLILVILRRGGKDPKPQKMIQFTEEKLIVS